MTDHGEPMSAQGAEMRAVGTIEGTTLLVPNYQSSGPQLPGAMD